MRVTINHQTLAQTPRAAVHGQAQTDRTKGCTDEGGVHICRGNEVFGSRVVAWSKVGIRFELGRGCRGWGLVVWNVKTKAAGNKSQNLSGAHAQQRFGG